MLYLCDVLRICMIIIVTNKVIICGCKVKDMEGDIPRMHYMSIDVGMYFFV